MSAKIEIDIKKPLYQQLRTITQDGIVDKLAFFTPQGGFMAKHNAIEPLYKKEFEDNPFISFTFDEKNLNGDTVALTPEPPNGDYLDIPLFFLKAMSHEERWNALIQRFTNNMSSEAAMSIITNPSAEDDIVDQAYAAYLHNIMRLREHEEQTGATGQSPYLYAIVLPNPITIQNISFQLAFWHAAHGFFPANYPFVANRELQEAIARELQDPRSIITNEEMAFEIFDKLTVSPDEFKLCADISSVANEFELAVQKEISQS